MFDHLLSAVALPATSVVIFVAYRHPSAFARLYGPLKPLLGYALLVTLGLMFGDNQAKAAIGIAMKQLGPEEDSIRKALAPVLLDNSNYLCALGIIVGLYVFLEALTALPRVGIVAHENVTAAKAPAVTELDQGAPAPDRPKTRTAA